MKILIAEDEKDLANAVSMALKINKYDVDIAYNGQQAFELAKKNYYDAIVSDIMMPVMDGITFLKKLRALGNQTPLLLLTAKAEIDDRVDGMDAGANDYLSKPFAIKELLARIRAMIRISGNINITSLQHGTVSLSQATFELKGRYASVILSKRESMLLILFLQNPGKQIEIEACNNVLGTTKQEEVEIYISFLNSKLEAVKAEFSIKEKQNAYCLEDN